MGKEERARETRHVLTLPIPAQGHMNPMLQFSKRLASKSLSVTIVAFTDKDLIKLQESTSLTFECISQEEDQNQNYSDLDEYFVRFRALVSRNLPDVVAKRAMLGSPISCLIYDSIMPWALDLARELGLKGGPFFTQPGGVSAIYYRLHEGDLRVPIEDVGCLRSLQGMPSLEVCDLPTFFHDDNYAGALNKLMTDQFSNVAEVDWMFMNTYNSLEEEALNWMVRKCPKMKPIGPTIPSKYLDKRLEDDKDYVFSLFKPTPINIIKWLDTKETNSVVYVSFGSVSTLEETQMEELAHALRNSNQYFLWVVRESESQKLPNNFMEEVEGDRSEKGLVVTWCPQLEVLAHKSIGCFMTHCGWNSTLEALSLGVPMVTMPQLFDQPTNAKWVSDVWKVGARVKVDERHGVVKREEIEGCLMEVMEGERGIELRRNVEKWKELAKEAVDDGGSSDNNIQEFVSQLLYMQ